VQIAALPLESITPSIIERNGPSSTFLKRNFITNAFRSKDDVEEEKLNTSRERVASKSEKITSLDLKRLTRSGWEEDRKLVEEHLHRLNSKETKEFAKQLKKQTLDHSQKRADGLDKLPLNYEAAHWKEDHKTKEEVMTSSKEPETDKYHHRKVQKAQTSIERIHKIGEQLSSHIENNLVPKAKKSKEKKTLEKAKSHLEMVDNTRNLKNFHEKERKRMEDEEQARLDAIAAKKAKKVGDSSSTTLVPESTRMSRGSGYAASESFRDESRKGDPANRFSQTSLSTPPNYNQEKAEPNNTKNDIKWDSSSSSSSSGEDSDGGSNSKGSRKSVTWADNLVDSGSSRSSSPNGSPKYDSISPNSVLPTYSSTFEEDLDTKKKRQKPIWRSSPRFNYNGIAIRH